MRLSSSLAFLAVFPIVNLALKVKLPRDHNPKLGPRDSHLRIKRRGCQIASSASSIPATSTSSTLVLPSDKSVGGLQIPSNSTGVLNQTPAIDSSVVAISGGSFNYGKDKIKGVNLGGACLWLPIRERVLMDSGWLSSLFSLSVLRLCPFCADCSHRYLLKLAIMP